MQVTHIDHVNIRIPADAVGAAVSFYHGVLGFEPVKLEQYRDGERTSFAFRMGETSLLHVRPKEEFEEPSGRNYDHCCIVVEGEIDVVRERLEDHGVTIRRESTPWGSTGRAPALYVEDPFGYVIEVKQADL